MAAATRGSLLDFQARLPLVEADLQAGLAARLGQRHADLGPGRAVYVHSLTLNLVQTKLSLGGHEVGNNA
jgi:hypothetical protein